MKANTGVICLLLFFRNHILTYNKPSTMHHKLFVSLLVAACMTLLWSTLRHSNKSMVRSQRARGNVGLEMDFNLRHIYSNVPAVAHVRLDIDDPLHSGICLEEGVGEFSEVLNRYGMGTTFTIKSQLSQIQRLKDRSPDMTESLVFHTLLNPQVDTHSSLEWVVDDILVPNITDPKTILTLAKLASNAYARLPMDPSWRDVEHPDTQSGIGYNLSDSFGWEEKGVRGHVFVENVESDKNRAPLVLIAIKGTSAAVIGGGNGGDDGEGGSTGDDHKTVEMDKFNDNLLFSCCCARVSSLWSTVCDCYEKTYTCNQNCLENSLRHPDRYYKAALEIYRNVVELYPESEIWVTGHSLGGVLSSLLGRTYGLPAVTFEAPGDMLATKRLHLPSPPGLPFEMEHIWHFGNNADPIFMGVCNGASSSCGIAGYAMESRCHSGLKCTYDTVTEKGWHVNILNHRLANVIDNLLSVTNTTAECIRPPPCIDCYDWTFVDHSENKRRVPKISTSSSSIPSSSSSESSTTTATRKRKCLKYTWYGSCYKWDDEDDDEQLLKHYHDVLHIASTTSTII